MRTPGATGVGVAGVGQAAGREEPDRGWHAKGSALEREG